MSTLQSDCPICGGKVVLAPNLEVSEIITCGECHNRLVVESIADAGIVLKEAPKVEEDWGE